MGTYIKKIYYPDEAYYFFLNRLKSKKELYVRKVLLFLPSPENISYNENINFKTIFSFQGFTKEFSSLSALITHHSVMPELLPCPLSLSRQTTRDAEHEFEETEQKTCDIFADIHWLMTDLEL